MASWETAAYASCMIDVAVNTLFFSIENLPDAEFFYNFDGTIPAVVALHLSGQLAWAAQVTTGEKDRRGEGFYGVAKGGQALDAIVSELPIRSEIQDSYIENGRKAKELLNGYQQDTWASKPLDETIITAFPSHAHVWTGVIWHTFWHIGELGSKVPYLRARPELTHPTMFRGVM